MNPARLARLVAADFTERTRRYGFLVTLAFTVWAATIFVPPPGAGYTTVDVHGHRGFYNSAWIGAQLTLLVNAFLGLAGFYLVKSAIDRDRQTRVGELLAATPLSRVGYTLTKMLSNLAVLSSMVAVVVVCSAVLQWVRAEDTHINPLALVLPHLLITWPYMALVAAIAVLFEVLPILRGGVGNIAWFILWSAGAASGFEGRRPGERFNDPMGVGTVFPSLIQAARRAFPAENITGEHVSMGIQIGGNGGRPLIPFAYGGIELTPEVIASRLLWLGVAFAIAVVAALPFDRFAAEHAGARGRVGRRRPSAPGDAGQAGLPARPATTAVDLGRLATTPPRRRFGLPALVRAEVVVALKGYPRAWYLVAIGLSIAALLVPLAGVKQYVAPVLAVWPILVWSSLGARELRHGTADLFFSAPRPLARQLPATWLAGVAIGVLVSGAYGFRLVIAGEGLAALTWWAGMLFVPALAVACGVLTASSRLFEALYLLFWYAAALNHVPGLDFTGATAAQTGPIVAVGYAAVTAVLLALAWGARRRQLSR